MSEPVSRADLQSMKKYRNTLGTAHIQGQIITSNILLAAASGESHYIDDPRPIEEDELTEDIILKLMDNLPDTTIYILLNYRSGARHIVVDWS
jgi:hypothetical protein